ncbi:thiamine phosphate synthase [Anatilimnocola sp. NA78]|uniref:thiamine phosphate synthase n=1 Tax=Anatilimnocola sp. NA78 TaxID=3415683 RepID=UPI003CE55519
MTPAESAAALRAIDANFNRAVEGLRVVEDQARFVLNDAFLARSCKQLRHDLTTALVELLGNPSEHFVARDTLADVGTAITSPQETERISFAQLAAANWQRASQALRVIEEFAKLLGNSGAPFESLRYQTYTLAKAFVVNERSLETWRGRQLYVLVDGGDREEQFEQRVKLLLAAGVHVLQLRDKKLDDRSLLSRARLLRKLIDETIAREERPMFIMNDRLDLALLARADGVHVGQDELPVSEVRQLVGTAMQIGVSTHSIEQARAAVLAGADYLGCGPTFPSGTKQFEAFPGIAFLQQVAAEISLPAFAIGGITAENLPEVIASGITRIAVSGAITTSNDPAAAVQRLLAQLTA